MAIVQILKQRQITLPTSICKSLHLSIGDLLDTYVDKHAIVLKPKKNITKPDQSWFWTQKWQMKEREADKDIAEGRLIGPFSDAQTAIKMLKSKNRKI